MEVEYLALMAPHKQKVIPGPPLKLFCISARLSEVGSPCCGEIMPQEFGNIAPERDAEDRLSPADAGQMFFEPLR